MIANTPCPWLVGSRVGSFSFLLATHSPMFFVFRYLSSTFLKTGRKSNAPKNCFNPNLPLLEMLHSLCNSSTADEVEGFFQSIIQSEYEGRCGQIANQKNDRRYTPLHVAIFSRWDYYNILFWWVSCVVIDGVSCRLFVSGTPLSFRC